MILDLWVGECPECQGKVFGDTREECLEKLAAHRCWSKATDEALWRHIDKLISN